MEGNSWRPAQGDPTSATSAGAGAGGADPSAVDWRAQLQHEARQRIVNKIMETLKRHLPISVPEGLNELHKIAVRFEEKIYTAATCQADYLKKISLKMLSMESKTHPTPAINAGQPQNPGDPVLSIPPQVSSQSQSLAIPLINQSSARQALLPQNIQNNTSAAVPTASSNLSSGLSTLTGVGQPSTLQNMSGMSQNNASHSVGQVAPTDIYANTQRQIQGRQQILSQQQQQSQNQLIYQQQQKQLQQQFLKQNYPNSSLMQPHIQQQQQQQQSLLQPNTLQSSQQSMMQMSSGLQQTQPTAMQQNQLNSIQQPVSSLRQQQQVQSTMHQQTSLQQQSAQVPQQPNIPLQTNISNSQQNQLIGGQQNSASDMQQPQQRLPVQQNSLLSMQQNQQILNQQTISLHQQQQQLVPQNNMSGLQQQQQQQQQQQMPGTVPNMQAHQRQMSILQQSKAVPQQQPQGQLQSAQQQVMSQFQSQPGQLQQQFGMQQQQNSLPREMQQRIQASAALLQPQNAADQQKLFMQSQRPLQEVSSSTSVESTAQTGPAGGVDWQEEIYQKIISMKELYFADLSELSQRIVMKLQQHDTLMPPGKLSEQYEKMKSFKGMLDRTLAILKLNKGNIQSGLKDKLPLYEKQIVSILASHKKKPPQPQGPQQQFQHSHSMPQQQPSQVPPMPKLENQMNQLQQVNMQPTANTMQQAGGASGLQHVSMPMSANFGVPNTQQNMTNSLQAVSNLDSIQSSSLSQLQQGPIGSLQHNSVGSMQNPINASQQVNSNALPHGTMNSLQSNVNSSQPNSSTLQQQQQLKQQQEQQRLQQMKQLQQRQMQQLLQQQQQQQQQQLPLQQQQQLPLQQQLHQQQKQQQVAQMSMHQIPQMNHQATEVNEVKMRQGPGMKPGLYPQNFSGSQRAGFYHQQLKPAAPFPISSPQNLQASSPQISHHSSPQIDQHNLLSSQIKAGTPLQSTNSPFVPSPSTPIAPSPVPSETEKQVPNVSSLPSGGQIGSQQANLPAPAQSLAVGTPGISASPLLAEFARPDGNQANLPTLAPYKAGTTESPLDRLLKVVQSASPQALSSAVSDIGSVVSMIDRIAGSAPGNGSRAAVGEDLVAMTKCRLQARNFMSQDGNSTNKKMKRDTNAMPLNNVSSAGSVNDSFMQLYGLDASELQSTATSRVKKHKAEVNHALVEEIREINQQLIDTVVNISEEDADSLAASSEGGDGTVIICSYTAVALCPSLKSQFASAQISPILPLRLLVPANYPKCSPVLLDKLPDEQRESDDLSTKAKTKFNISLRGLSQPMSLKEIAKTWDSCARKAIAEYAQQTGGGSFSSRFGAWENCVGA